MIFLYEIFNIIMTKDTQVMEYTSGNNDSNNLSGFLTVISLSLRNLPFNNLSSTRQSSVKPGLSWVSVCFDTGRKNELKKDEETLKRKID